MEYRKLVIGYNGDRVAKIMKLYDVQVTVPMENDPDGKVRVKGLVEDVDRATQDIQKIVTVSRNLLGEKR